MTRVHKMPFGASFGPHGEVVFNLWAPAAAEAGVRLFTASGTWDLAMKRCPGGAFTLATQLAGVGDRYFYIVGGKTVPDPASRFQPDDVHGASAVVDPHAHVWTDDDWPGRPWEETVLYELHVGSFTAAGTYAAAAEKLEELAALGVTAIELMPLAAAPGGRNWGYDGVYPFAPNARYGMPGDLKDFIARAHRARLMVFLDVVYNHFGPEGNYLASYAPQFFTERHKTPWGAGINFDGRDSAMVRRFFIDNALYWIEEYHFDGLRFDAVHAIADDSPRHILVELAQTVRAAASRPVHLVIENDENAAALLARGGGGQALLYDAQWADDIHHAFHVLLTGETQGYYGDYADDPARHLARALAEGFAYQGEESAYRGGRPRSTPSADLPPTAFVSFLQNHDQIGNRARGERISALAPPEAIKAATAILLLAPPPPLLFMGEEWSAAAPFNFFCDFPEPLAQAVRDGRRAAFVPFLDAAGETVSVPDPTAEATFTASILDRREIERRPHAEWLAFHRALLAARARSIVPRLAGARTLDWRVEGEARRAFTVRWRLGDGARLTLLSHLAGRDCADVTRQLAARPIFATHEILPGEPLPPWFAAWWLEERAGG